VNVEDAAPVVPPTPDRVAELLVSFQRLLKTPYSYDDWMHIFEDDALWGLEARERFEYGLFRAIEGQALPRWGWQAIDARFRWSEDAQRLYRTFPDADVDSVLGAITETLRPTPSGSTKKESAIPGWAFWILVLVAVNVLRQCAAML